MRIGILFVCAITAIAALLFMSPDWSWDALGYIASGLELRGHPADNIGAASYAALERVVPPAALAELRDGGVEFRRVAAADPDVLPRLIPFYRGRYLYLWLTVGLARTGFEPARACLIVSVLSFWATGLLLFSQLRRSTGGLAAALAALVVMILPPVTQAGRAPTPDALCAFLATLAFVGLLRRRAAVFAAAAILAMLTRSDSFIVLGAGLIFWRFLRDGSARLSNGLFAGMAAALLGLWIAIPILSGAYGWHTVFTHTFLEKLSDPATFTGKVAAGAYLRIALIKAATALRTSSLAVFLAFGLAAWWLSGRTWTLADGAETRRLLACLGCSVLIHFIGFPVIWDRFFIAQYILTALLVMRLSADARSGGRGLPSAVDVADPAR